MSSVECCTYLNGRLVYTVDILTVIESHCCHPCRRHASVWLLSADGGNCTVIEYHRLRWSGYVLDEMQWASTKPRQDWSVVVRTMTASTTDVAAADRHLLHHSGPVHPRTWRLHLLWSVDVDARTTHAITMPRLATSTTSNPSRCTVGHSSDVVGWPHWHIPDWTIWEWCAGTQYWTTMWANAQPDGRTAEHRWHPLFNAQSLADAHYLTAAQ